VEGASDAPGRQMSIWQFLINNEKGAIFQLMPRNRNTDQRID